MAQLEKNLEITPETPSKPSTPSKPETPSKPSKPGTGTETTKPNNKPQTGDSTMLGLAAFFTMISLLGYVLLKKKEAEDKGRTSQEVLLFCLFAKVICSNCIFIIK